MDLAADGNGNGTVDQADYIIWKSNFIMTTNSSADNNMVPEPSALLLVACTVIALGSVPIRSAAGQRCLAAPVATSG